MHSSVCFVLLAGMAGLIHGGTSQRSAHNKCISKEQRVWCKCNEMDKEFNMDVDELDIFEKKSEVFITDCALATLHFYIFETAFDMKSLYLERIKELTFESQLPPKLENVVIKNVGLVNNISAHILLTHPILSTFSIENSTISLMDMNVFTDVSVKDIIFKDVVFQNIIYASKYAQNDEETNASESVSLINCHFESSIPSHTFQFKVKTSYRVMNCIFDGPLHEDAIHISTKHVAIQNNIFVHLDRNSIVIHHYDNGHSLHVHILNNTIKSMDKNAIFFQENLQDDISEVANNIFSCNRRPQCDERTSWLLNAFRHLTTFAPTPKLMCKVLSKNQCKDAKTGISPSMLFALKLGEECTDIDVTLTEKILEDCTDEFEHFANYTKQLKLYQTDNTAHTVTSTTCLVLFWLVQLWVL